MADNVLNLRTDATRVRVMINDDVDRVIEFDPSDVAFAERFYKLIADFETKQDEYQRRAEELDAQRDELDHNGLPVNLGDSLAFLREVCEFMHAQIDFLFGPGTAQKAFGGVLSMDAIEQFFEGITPFITQLRADKLAKYAPSQTGKKVMR